MLVIIIAFLHFCYTPSSSIGTSTGIWPVSAGRSRVRKTAFYMFVSPTTASGNQN